MARRSARLEVPLAAAVTADLPSEVDLPEKARPILQAAIGAGATHLLRSKASLFRGGDPLISRRQGRELAILVAPDDPHPAAYLGFVHHLLTREFLPLHRVSGETINGDVAAHSPYLDALRTLFDVVVDYKSVVVYKKH